MRRSGIAAVTVIAWLASGCSVLAPQPDVSRYFVLTPVVETTAVGAGPATDGTRSTLAVGPVVLPAYLDRLQIVRRSGENQLVLSSTGVWGEPLERNVQGVVSANLARLLAGAEIVPYPSFTATGIDQQVSIAILRFDADEHDRVSLDARWTIQRPADKGPVDARESHIVLQAADGSTAAMVAAMSQAIGALSQEIAGKLR
ncbi:MAG TPA: PqiC family protein [Myxococcota bacterium]|nr:PqiC family protein [Myxococcota bacterium]